MLDEADNDNDCNDNAEWSKLIAMIMLDKADKLQS